MAAVWSEKAPEILMHSHRRLYILGQPINSLTAQRGLCLETLEAAQYLRVSSPGATAARGVQP